MSWICSFLRKNTYDVLRVQPTPFQQQDTGAATTGGATWRITGTGRSRTGRGATGATGTGAGAGTGTGTGTGTSATCFANQGGMN